MQMTGGALAGAGNVTVSGNFTVTGGGGTLSGPGTLTTQGPALVSLDTSSSMLALNGGRTWRNQGSLELGGAGYVYLGSGDTTSLTNTLLNDTGATLTLSGSAASPIGRVA
jgi:hypothetical protein